MDGLFSAFNDDVRHIVRHTAKMAVLSSHEEQAIDRNDSVRDFITRREGRSKPSILNCFPMPPLWF